MYTSKTSDSFLYLFLIGTPKIDLNPITLRTTTLRTTSQFQSLCIHTCTLRPKDLFGQTTWTKRGEGHIYSTQRRSVSLLSVPHPVPSRPNYLLYLWFIKKDWNMKVLLERRPGQHPSQYPSHCLVYERKPFHSRSESRGFTVGRTLSHFICDSFLWES